MKKLKYQNPSQPIYNSVSPSNYDRSIQKHYPTTLLGYLQYLRDLSTDQTTYQQESTLVQPEGDPDFDVRRQNERNEDYLNSPLERAKQQISNDRSPLSGIYRTFVPAAIGSAAVTLVPSLLVRVPGVIKDGIRYGINNPRQALVSGRNKALSFGKDLAKGMIGAKAVDSATTLFTDKDFDELIAPYLGVSEDVASFLNPGWGLAGNRTIDNIIKKKKQFKNLYAKEGEYYRYFTNKANELQDQIDALIPIKSQKKIERYRKLEDIDRLQRVKTASKEKDYIPSFRNLSFFNPFIGSLKNRQAKLRINRGKIRDLVLGRRHPSLSYYQDINLNASGLSASSEQTIKFNETSSKLSSNSGGNTHINGVSGKDYKGNLEFQIRMQKSNSFPIIEGDTKAIQQSIQEYINELSKQMNGEGAVSGSLISYANGLIRGTDKNGLLIGPADTEIYTTAQRLPQLVKNLEFQQQNINSVGGLKGTSKYTFRNNDYLHNGKDTEINIIQESENGKAIGNIAHQIYRALYPEQYSKLVYDYALKHPEKWYTSNGIKSTFQMELPISAEGLFQLVRDNSQYMQRHLYTDMIGQETFTKSQNIKANQRLYSALFHDDPKTQQMLSDGIERLGKINTGSHFKLGTELYPNLRFDNIDANRKFLKTIFLVPRELSERFARNEQLMRNAFNLYNQSNSTGVRYLGNDVILEKTLDNIPYHDAKLELFNSPGSLGGGNGSGIGMNTAALNPHGGWYPGPSHGNSDSRNIASIIQGRLTYKPEDIKNPMDLVNQVEHLHTEPGGMYGNRLATFDPNRIKPVEYNIEKMNEIRGLARKNNLPIYINDDLFGYQYLGMLDEPISVGARVVTVGDVPELGSLLAELRKTRSDAFDYISVKNDEDLSQLLGISNEDIIDRLENIRKEIYDKFKIEKESLSKLSKEDRIKLYKREPEPNENGVERADVRHILKSTKNRDPYSITGDLADVFKKIIVDFNANKNEEASSILESEIDKIISHIDSDALRQFKKHLNGREAYFDAYYQSDHIPIETIKEIQKIVDRKITKIFKEHKSRISKLHHDTKQLKNEIHKLTNDSYNIEQKQSQMSDIRNHIGRTWDKIYNLERRFEDKTHYLPLLPIGLSPFYLTSLINKFENHKEKQAYYQSIGEQKPSYHTLYRYGARYQDVPFDSLFQQSQELYNQKHNIKNKNK